MASIWSQLQDASALGSALIQPWATPQRVELSDLLESAERMAIRIRRKIRDPRRLGILMANGEPFVRAILATLRLRAGAVPLALPTTVGNSDAYAAKLQRIVREAALDAVLVDDSTCALASRLQSALPDVLVLNIQVVPVERGRIDEIGDGRGDDLAIVQYTSGSTSAPKGVALTHDNVSAGLVPITGDWNWTQEDVMGVWLPLFHDMGLFSLLSALSRGSSVYLCRPSDFVRGLRSGEWLVDFVSAGITVMPGPNFAYDRIARAAAQRLPAGVDLSRLRAAVNGAEPVQRSTVEAFTHAFEPYGFRPEAMQPVYGMAEATLAVSFPNPQARPRFERVLRDSLGEGQRVASARDRSAEGRDMVSVGSAVTGIQLRLGDAAGSTIGNRLVGEVQVRGPAVMSGYLDVPPEKQPFTPDGWLRTGDLGFQLDGELFIVGRIKDIVILHGQNYYPEDAEEVVRQVTGMSRRHHCVALGLELDGEDTMAVLFETALEGDDAMAVAEDIRCEIAAQLGLTAVSAFPVPPRTIPHTSSGKVQRGAARALYEDRKPTPTRKLTSAEELR